MHCQATNCSWCTAPNSSRERLPALTQYGPTIVGNVVRELRLVPKREQGFGFLVYEGLREGIISV
jgi:hypothetical protein